MQRTAQHIAFRLNNVGRSVYLSTEIKEHFSEALLKDGLAVWIVLAVIDWNQGHGFLQLCELEGANDALRPCFPDSGLSKLHKRSSQGGVLRRVFLDDIFNRVDGKPEPIHLTRREAVELSEAGRGETMEKVPWAEGRRKLNRNSRVVIVFFRKHRVIHGTSFPMKKTNKNIILLFCGKKPRATPAQGRVATGRMNTISERRCTPLGFLR